MRLAVPILALAMALLSGVNYVTAQNYDVMNIGILRPHRPEVVQIIVQYGVYALKVDGFNISTLRTGERLTFSMIGSQVKVGVSGRTLGQGKTAELKCNDNSGVFRLYILQPGKFEAVYDDNLRIKTVGGTLQLVNEVGMEKYVAGVVEAETGKEKGIEFYKVQAIISRTYAISNRGRFAAQGYHLNDLVDCQVFHGKCRWEPDILEAVQQTAGKILVDSEMNPVTAAFHSNSGGETVGSEIVWSWPLPYLSPRNDEFSLNGDHYLWTRKINREKWLDYLRDKYDLNTTDKLIETMAVNYRQERRHTFFLDPQFDIPLKDVRKDWGLNSTFFDIQPAPVGYTGGSIQLAGDSLLFTGRGFGHGAGLSQEGAMRMAELGFPYSDIIHFYYDDVHIIDLRALEFFRRN